MKEQGLCKNTERKYFFVQAKQTKLMKNLRYDFKAFES